MAPALVCQAAKFRPRRDVVSQRRRRGWRFPAAQPRRGGGAGCVPPCFPVGTAWAGLEEPRGDAATHPGTRWGHSGEEEEEEEEEEEGAACLASPRDSTHAGAVARCSPRCRASPSLPEHCAGPAAGNGCWQQPLTLPGTLGHAGRRVMEGRFAGGGSGAPAGAPPPCNTTENMRTEACSQSAAQALLWGRNSPQQSPIP